MLNGIKVVKIKGILRFLGRLKFQSGIQISSKSRVNFEEILYSKHVLYLVFLLGLFEFLSGFLAKDFFIKIFFEASFFTFHLFLPEMQ